MPAPPQSYACTTQPATTPPTYPTPRQLNHSKRLVPPPTAPADTVQQAGEQPPAPVGYAHLVGDFPHLFCFVFVCVGGIVLVWGFKVVCDLLMAIVVVVEVVGRLGLVR